MPEFSINKWRKKAISMYGTSRGLNASQRANVTSAVHGTKTYKAPASKSKPRGTRKVAKKQKKRRAFTIPLAVVVPLAASLFTEGKKGWSSSPFGEMKAGRYENAMHHLVSGWLGIDAAGRFDAVNGMTYLKMTLIGAVVHWIAGKVGINRVLGRAKVPFIRI